MTTRLTPIVSLYYVFYFVEIAVISHLRAIGRLTVPALLTFVVFYLIVIPLAAMFAFLTNLSLYGIYLANAFGALRANIQYISRTYRYRTFGTFCSLLRSVEHIAALPPLSFASRFTSV